jgi:hypothetical protein
MTLPYFPFLLMNSDIIPQGPSELVGVGSITREALFIKATAALTLTNVVFSFPATPANAAAATGCALPAGDALYNVKSCTIGAGAAYVVYRK